MKRETKETLLILAGILLIIIVASTIENRIETKKFQSKQKEIVKIIETRLNKIEKLNDNMQALADEFGAEYEKVSQEKNLELLKQGQECKNLKELEYIIENN